MTIRSLGLLLGLSLITSIARPVGGASLLQTGSTRFDTVLVKKAGGPRRQGPDDPGRFYRPSATLRSLILTAYQVSVPRTFDGPSWIDSTSWEIDARTTRPQVTGAERRQMVRQLLIDRFGLRVHMERRTVPVIVVTVGRRNAPGLRSADPGCAPFFRGEKPMKEAPSDRNGLSLCDPPTFELKDGLSTMRRRNVPIAGVVMELENLLDHVVSDETKLMGNFDIDLGLPPGWGPGQDPDLPALLVAIEKQWGLSHETREMPADVLVIDAAKLPVEDR